MGLTNLTSLTSIARIAQNVDGTEVVNVNINNVISKAQVRKRFRNIEELAESLKSEGLQSPIIVSPVNARGEYVIQKGERRWRAAKLAGFDKIDVIINKKLQSEIQQVIGELVENIQRDDLTPMEIAHAIGQLVDGGQRQSDIARNLGKSRAYVSMHMALLKLPECVKELSSNELVEDADTLATLRQLYELDPAECVRVCEKVRERKGITRKQAREVLAQVREKLAPTTPSPSEPGTNGQTDLQPSGSAESSVSPGELGSSDEPRDSTPPTKAVDEMGESRSPFVGDDADTVGNRVPKETAKPSENPFLDEVKVDSTKPVEQAQPKTAQDEGVDEGPWVRVAADEVVITVSVLMDSEEFETGRLLIDRVSKDKTQAWVLLDGRDEPVCVDTAVIQVNGIGTSNGH